MKVEDIVMLDRGYRNAGPVKLISMRKLFCTVEANGRQWVTMCSRVSEINDEDLSCTTMRSRISEMNNEYPS